MLKSTIFKLTGVVLPLAIAATAQTAVLGKANALALPKDEMKLALGFASTQFRGQTVGSYGLANIASRDSNGEFCLGYADRNPDYIVTLEQDFNQLTLEVNSGGADTTLLVQGAGTVRCNDNASRQNRDAKIQGTFTRGTYKVWIGAFDQEGRHRYNLTIAE